MTDTKPCSKCGEIYPLTAEYYAPCAKLKSGFNGVCRVCQRKQAIARYDRRLAEMGRTRQAREPYSDYVLKRQAAWRERNIDRVREYQRSYLANQKRKRFEALLGGLRGV